MRASLVRVKADGTAQPIPVRSSPTVVGRHEDCELRIPLPEVSRRHCEITLEDGRLMIKDLGSSNGTYLNREKVSGPTMLDAGDLVSLGGLVFVVKIDGQPDQIDAPLCFEDGQPLGDEPPTRPAGPSHASEDRTQPAGRGSLIDDELSELSDDLDDSSVLDFDFDLNEDDSLGKQPEL